MSRHIHTNYYQDNLDKRVCPACHKQFIVGEVLAQGCNILCPYCGSNDVLEYALVDSEDALEALGCGGIYFEAGEGGKP